MQLKETLTLALKDSVVSTFSSIFSLIPKTSESGGLCDIQKHKGVFVNVGLAGTLEGSLMLFLQDRDACKVVSKMLFMEIEEVVSDVLDGCGELGNILSGDLKTKLDGSEYSFEFSIPSVLHAENIMDIARMESAQTIQLAVECEEFSFVILLSFMLKKDRDAEMDKFAQNRQERASSALEDLIGK